MGLEPGVEVARNPGGVDADARGRVREAFRAREAGLTRAVSFVGLALHEVDGHAAHGGKSARVVRCARDRAIAFSAPSGANRARLQRVAFCIGFARQLRLLFGLWCRSRRGRGRADVDANGADALATCLASALALV